MNCNLGNCRRLLFTCENVFFSSQNETYFNTMLSYTKIYKNKRIDEESRKFRTTTEFESFVSLLLRDNTSEAMSYQLPMCWFQSSMVMARSEGNSLLPSVISWKVRSPNFSRKILILRFKKTDNLTLAKLMKKTCSFVSIIPGSLGSSQWSLTHFRYACEM